MKILIGVDDSPHSNAAVGFVTRMPWPPATRALVVSSVRTPVAAYAEIYVPAAVPTDEVLAEQIRASGELVARVEKELRAAGLEARATVMQGDPREVLVEVAKQEGVDLVIVGSHGRTGLAKLVMGSVATHVTAHAPCSVLVVKLPGRVA